MFSRDGKRASPAAGAESMSRSAQCRQPSFQKRIARALAADRAGRAVAADEGDVVAERQELFPDRAEQRLMAAARQVGATDRAAEQHVAHDGEAVGGVEE